MAFQFYKREADYDLLTLYKDCGLLAPSVTVDWCGAFAIITEFTDMIYLVFPTGIQTVNPWISKQQPCLQIPNKLLFCFMREFPNIQPTVK